MTTETVCAPDVETASDDDASRFRGPAGDYLLAVQERSIVEVLPERAGMTVLELSHTPSWRRLLAEMCRVACHCVIVDYPRTVGFNALTPALFALKRRIEGNTREYISFSDRTIDSVLRENTFAATHLVDQFVLPMAVHRLTKARMVSRGFEGAARRLGLTRAFGSPAIIRADRTDR